MRILVGFIVLASSLQVISQPDSLTLKSCVQMALRQNPELNSKRYDQKISREAYRQAKSDRLPSLDFDASLRHQSDVPKLELPSLNLGTGQAPITLFPGGIKELGSRTTYDLSLTVSQPLFTGFRLYHRQKASQASMQARQFETSRQRAALVYKVESAYGHFLQAKQVLQIAKTSLEQVTEHLKDIENLYHEGLARKDELLKVKVRLSDAELRLIKSKNGVDLAKTALERVIGTALPAKLHLADFEIDLAVTNLQSCIDTAMVKRPELFVISEAQEAANHAVEIQRGEKYPSLAAFARAAYGKPGPDFIEDEWMYYWVVGVGAEWSLWQWGNKHSRVEQAKLARKKLQEQERDLLQTIRMDVTNAWFELEEKKKSLELIGTLKEQALESFQISRDRYRQGVTTNTEFLDAQSDLTRARVQQARAFIDLQLAGANLKRAMGKNFDNQEEEW